MVKLAFIGLEKWEETHIADKLNGLEFEFHPNISEGTEYDAEIVGTFIFTPFTKEVIGQFPNLKMIATFSTGYDHIDLEECARKEITVCNVPAYGDHAVAELTFGLILDISRNIHMAIRRTSRENLFSRKGMIGSDITGKTLGVIGVGSIGINTIHSAKGFDMNVIAYDAFPKEELQEKYDFKFVSFDEVLANSDIITLHVPLLKSTYHLIDEKAIEKMKQGVYIINTSRGPVIDTSALISGLNSGKIAGTGLDVIEGESLIRDHEDIPKLIDELQGEDKIKVQNIQTLMKHPNAIITPHLASMTLEAKQKVLDVALGNIFDFVDKKDLKNKISL